MTSQPHRLLRLTAAAAVAATCAAGVAFLPAPAAHAAGGYLCTETGCPAGEGWVAARGFPGAWKSYWYQAAGHNCTNYVAWRLSQNGVPMFRTNGNATTWAATARAAGLVVDNTPTVGSIAQWEAGKDGIGSGGHVAYVQAVNGSTVTIAEDSWYGGSQVGPFDWRNVAASSPSYYIHFPGSTSSDATAAGSLGAPTRFAVTGADGTVTTRESGTSWVTQTGNAAATTMDGNRIGVLGRDGTFIIKDGSMYSGWVTEAGNVAQALVDGDRIAIVDGSGNLFVKTGSIYSGWTLVARGAAQVAMDGDRLAVRQTDGQVVVKQGSIFSPWVHVADGTDVALGGQRIAVLGSDGSVKVKEGPLTAGWVLEIDKGATNVEASSRRIGVQSSDGSAVVKDGSIYGSWTSLGTGVAKLSVADYQLAVVTTGGVARLQQGSVTAGWRTESTQAAGYTFAN